MPCATVHLLVADLAWARWERGTPPPFPVSSETRHAFLHGSLAPDLGFIPGVDRIVSELAHYHRPADLARSLMSRAESDTQRAFAWGWVAHVLGDVEIHPLVGRAVGERIHGRRDRRMNAAEDVETHVSVEVGLDMTIRRRGRSISPPPSRPLYDAQTVGWIAEALEAVYAVRWTTPELAAWHRTAVLRTKRWPLALGLLSQGAGEWKAQGRRWVRPVLGALERVSRPGTPARGFLSPRRPPPWVLEEFDEAVQRVLEQLDEASRAGIEDLPNRNLESGAYQDGGDPHPEASAVRRRLETLLAVSGRPPTRGPW